MQHEILKQIEAQNARLLGEGIEAWVYELSDVHVVRIYKSTVVLEHIQNLKQFYDSLDTSAVSFAIPQIDSINKYNDTVYTIERQLKGKSLREQLVSGNAESLLKKYLQVAEKKIALLHTPYDYFGEVLSSQPLRSSSWPDFLQAKTQRAFQTAAALFKTDVPGIEQILHFIASESALVANVTHAKLVHGDFNASNVLSDSGDITALTDFGDLTLAGDPRMDIASGIIGFMEKEDGMRRSDGEFLLAYLRAKYGTTIQPVIHLYRMYYAVCFASYCKESDPRTYAWCLRTFAEHLTGQYDY